MQLDAWGNVRAENNPGDLYQPIRLPGQHADGNTGLNYNRHRYYQPLTGKYINHDPIGIEGGINTYAYAFQSPAILTDPTGQFVPVLMGIGAGIAFDYFIEKYKERNCCGKELSCTDSLLGTEGNAAVGGAIGATGPFDAKPRTGIAGGGRAGATTSVASKINHAAAKKGYYSVRTRNLVTKGLRKVPYLGVAVSGYEIYDATSCE